MKLLSLVEYIDSLASTSSTTKKKTILKSAPPEFIMLCKLIHGSDGIRPRYGISLDRYNSLLEDNPVPSSESTWTDLQPVIRRLTSFTELPALTNDHVTALASDISSIDLPGRVLVSYIIEGSLNAGVSYKLLQTTHPTVFIPDIKPMLASGSGQYTFPVFIQPKYDGARALAKVQVKPDTLEIEIKSRNGKVYQFLPTDNIILELSSLVESNIVGTPREALYDTPLYVDGELSNNSNRQSSNGIATKLVKGTASDSERNDIGFNVWDITYYGDKRELKWRYHALEKAFTGKQFTNVNLTPSYVVNSQDEISAYMDTLDRELYDGVIIKTLDSLYEFNTRSKHWIKVKDEFEMELRVVDVRPGTGKYEGQIGSLVCTDATGTLSVSIGTGLSDEDRSNSPEVYIGKIVSVKYNKVIPNSADTGYTLFLPVFVALRFDKDQPDSVSS